MWEMADRLFFSVFFVLLVVLFFFCLLDKFPEKVSCLHGSHGRATDLPFAAPTSVALPVSNAAIAVIFICW